MKTAFLFLAIFAVAQARPQFFQNAKNAATNFFKFDNSGDGKYSYDVETSDNFKQKETGFLKNEGTPEESLVVRGSYSYIGDDGKNYEVKYIADENGFQPDGEHIPPAADTGKGPKTGIGSRAVGSLGGGL